MTKQCEFEAKAHVLSLVLRLIRAVYYDIEKSSRGLNLQHFLNKVDEQQRNDARTSLENFLLGVSSCKILDRLPELIRTVNDKRAFVDNKTRFLDSLHLKEGGEDVEFVQKSAKIWGCDIPQINQFLRKYTDFLLSETRESIGALRILIAYNTLCDAEWQRRYNSNIEIPYSDEFVVSFVKVASDYISYHQNSYEGYKLHPLSQEDFLAGLARWNGETFEDFDTVVLKYEEIQVLFEFYRLWEEDAFFGLLQHLIENGYDESISKTYRKGWECLFEETDETILRNSYLDYCIKNQICMEKRCISLLASEFRLQTLGMRTCSLDSKQIKVLFHDFMSQFQFCEIQHLQYIFLGRGTAVAFRPIRWKNGSMVSFRTKILELWQALYGTKRLPKGGWNIIRHNFVNARDKEFPVSIRTCSVRKQKPEPEDTCEMEEQ